MQKAIDSRSVSDARRLGAQRLLKRQHGIIHRTQAIAAGMAKQQIDEAIRRGRWLRVAPCLYTTSEHVSPMARMWIASLWGGTNTVITATAALYAAGRVTDPPAEIIVYTDPDRRHRPPPGIRTYRGIIDRRDYMWLAGLRVTRPARAALDLARWGAPANHIPMLLRTGAVTIEALRSALHRMTSLRDYDAAHEAVQRALKRPWSEPEQDLHGHLDHDGIIGWHANTAYCLDGMTIRPDLTFDAIRLAVEVEGAQFHSEAANRAGFERDAERRQRLEREGWVVLRFTPRQIRDEPASVIATIRARIEQLCTLHNVPEGTYLTSAVGDQTSEDCAPPRPSSPVP